MGRGPDVTLVRAGAAKATLDFTDVFEPGRRSRLESSIPSRTLEVYRHATAAAWIPFEHDRLFVRALLEHFGAEGLVRLCAASVPEHLERPLLRTFFSGVRNMFGLEDSQLIRFAVRPWPLVYRGFGEPSAVEGGRDSIVFRLDAVPEHVLDEPAYPFSWKGIVHGLLALYDPRLGLWGGCASQRDG